MPRKSRAQQFAALEDENIREQIPKKILPLIQQLVMEQFFATDAAMSLRMTLLEIRVKELEKRLGIKEPEPDAYDPMDDWRIELEKEREAAESADDSAQDPGEDPDEDRDEEIPF